MFEGKSIAVVVPCYNEQAQVLGVCSRMAALVDYIVIVDDASTDETAAVVAQYAATSEGSRVRLIRHTVNKGAGGAVATGFAACLDLGVDIVAVMDGDGQMNSDELAALIAPVAAGQADYAKANRLLYRDAWQLMPKHRYLGNAALSMMTKIASGYWAVADSQTGFIAMNASTLAMLDLKGLYGRFGYPNDLLVRLNVCDARVVEVPSRPIYHVGEQSKMRLLKVMPTISWLILRRFCWRMWYKYVVRDFHPLVLFYTMAAMLHVGGFALFVRMIVLWAMYGRIPPINAMMWVFCEISAMQLGLFAMWFDMEANRDLVIRAKPLVPPGRAAKGC